MGAKKMGAGRVMFTVYIEYNQLGQPKRRVVCFGACEAAVSAFLVGSSLVQSVLKFIALALALLWLPVTQHCGLEALGAAVLEHEEQHSEACGIACGTDSCNLIERVSYASTSARAELAVPVAVVIEPLFKLFSAPPPVAQVAPMVPVETIEVDALCREWVFARRTALLPGAPAILV